MMESAEEDVLATLALRYFDRAAGPADVAALERLLVKSETHRRLFLQMAQQTTVLSDYHRIDFEATALAVNAVGSKEWDRDSRVCAMVACEGDDHEGISLARSSSHSGWWRSLSAVAAVGAAAMVALAGLALWWAAEPPPINDAASPVVAVDEIPLVVDPAGASGVLLAAQTSLDTELPPISPWDDANSATKPMRADSHASLLFHSNSLFWSLCRLAAQSEARQAFSSTLLGMVPLEFSFEPYSFSPNENIYDWIYPRLVVPDRMNVEL